MAASTTGAQHAQRHASLKLSGGPNGQVLTARVPLELSEDDFVEVGRAAYRLIHRLTGCNCASGRISLSTMPTQRDASLTWTTAS